MHIDNFVPITKRNSVIERRLIKYGFAYNQQIHAMFIRKYHDIVVSYHEIKPNCYEYEVYLLANDKNSDKQVYIWIGTFTNPLAISLQIVNTLFCSNEKA
jgi:hypothetical protein